MSTQTVTPTQTFAQPSFRRLPSLGCVGRVTSVGNDKSPGVAPSKSGSYLVVPITITPFGAGKEITAYPCFRPEWLRSSFDPDTELYDPSTDTEIIEGGKSAHFVYTKNIRTARGDSAQSTFRGLAGSDAAFDRLAGMLLSLPNDLGLEAQGVSGPSNEDITTVLKKFFGSNQGGDGQAMKFIYILQQQETDTGEVEVDEDTGKEHKIKLLENRYDLKSTYDYTQKNLDKMIARAKKSTPERPFRWTFQNDAF